MENNKFWIYLGLAVVAALSLKWVSSPDSSISSKRFAIGANMSEDIQYKRAEKSNSGGHGLYQRRTTPLSTQIKSGATTAAPAAAAKKDEKLKNVAKKKDDKKKKKKKNKKPKIMGVPEDATSSDDDSDLMEARTTPPSGSAAPVAFQGPAQNAGAQLPTSLSDWERILLVTANHRETTRFIGLYQTRQIPAETFYGIVGQMVNDGRTQMRQLGIMALAATPSLESYTMLVSTNETEVGPLKSQTTRILDETYSRPLAIKIIHAALTKEVSVSTQLQALNNLIAIIENKRNPSSQPGETTDVVAPSKSDVATQQYVRDFFSRILRDAMPSLRQSKDPRVQALAQTVSGQLTAALTSPIQPEQRTASN